MFQHSDHYNVQRISLKQVNVVRYKSNIITFLILKVFVIAFPASQEKARESVTNVPKHLKNQASCNHQDTRTCAL